MRLEIYKDTLSSMSSSFISFDTICCEVPLPIPPEASYLEGIRLDELDFQTGDLKCDSSHYIIDEPRRLILVKIKTKTDPVSGLERETGREFIPQNDFSGGIRFWTYFVGEDHGKSWDKDYYLEFTAVFLHGKLLEIIHTVSEAHDVNVRRAKEKEFSKNVFKASAHYGKLHYVAYEVMIKLPLFFIARVSVASMHFVSTFLVRCIGKLP